MKILVLTGSFALNKSNDSFKYILSLLCDGKRDIARLDLENINMH